MSGLTEQDKKRIIAIACKLVEGQVAKGEVDPDDEKALKAATKKAVQEARTVYFAALEYVSG